MIKSCVFVWQCIYFITKIHLFGTALFSLSKKFRNDQWNKDITIGGHPELAYNKEWLIRTWILSLISYSNCKKKKKKKMTAELSRLYSTPTKFMYVHACVADWIFVDYGN
jgi:hypothetical protein